MILTEPSDRAVTLLPPLLEVLALTLCRKTRLLKFTAVVEASKLEPKWLRNNEDDDDDDDDDDDRERS